MLNQRHYAFQSMEVVVVDGPDNLRDNVFAMGAHAAATDDVALLRKICDLFADSWSAERPLRIESLVSNVNSKLRGALLDKLLAVDLMYRRQHGEAPVIEEYLARFKGHEEVVRQHFVLVDESMLASCGTTLSAKLPPLASGDRNAGPAATKQEASGRLAGDQVGRYQLTNLLGTGGFAEVWRAKDPLLDRMVAIKFMRRERRTAEASLALLNEARRVARMSLAGVVPVYDVADVNGCVHIVSRYIDGGTLADQMRMRRYTPVEAAQLTAEIAETLHQAHLQNVVHRDIKPSNILIDQQNRPWVADFGLAITEAEQQTEQPGVMGTVAYMSPEQVAGGSNLLDARTDIYSLGVVLYQLLTGRQPFAAQNFVDFREQIIRREPRPLRTIIDTLPPELERICLKCLAKAIPARYLTAGDMARDLRSWIAESAGVSQAPRVEARSAPHSVRKIVLACAIVVPLFSVVGLIWIFRMPHSDRSDVAHGQETKSPARDINQHAGGNGTSADSGPKPVSDPDPLGWRATLGRTPQELIWPGYQGANSASLGFKETVRAYEITSNSPRFVELGELTKCSGAISIGIRQPIWTGACAGLFLGYHRRVDQGRPAACFQALYLSKVNDESGKAVLHVSRAKGRIAPETGTLHIVQELGMLPVKWPAPEATQRLEIQLGPSGLQSARWGAEELDALCSPFWNQSVTEDQYLGSWGIFHEYGTTWFQDPLYTPEASQEP